MEVQNKLKELYSAIANSDIGRVKKLLGDNPELLYIETPNGSWLHVASRRSDMEIVKFLIDSGLDINQKGGISDEMPINLAASEGNLELVKFYLENGAILDESEPEKNPLFAAIHNGNIDIVKILIECGVNYNIKYGKKSPISFAKQFGHKNIVKFLKNL